MDTCTKRFNNELDEKIRLDIENHMREVEARANAVAELKIKQAELKIKQEYERLEKEKDNAIRAEQDKAEQDKQFEQDCKHFEAFFDALFSGELFKK